jgi:hypothetical protein
MENPSSTIDSGVLAALLRCAEFAIGLGYSRYVLRQHCDEEPTAGLPAGARCRVVDFCKIKEEFAKYFRVLDIWLWFRDLLVYEYRAEERRCS